MECEIIDNLIRIIQDKRKDFIKKNHIIPNMIVMDRANQVLLNMHFINKIGTDMDTIYGMKVLVDNSIIKPEDIKMYYWTELERQDVEEIDNRKIRYDINHFDSIKEYLEIFSDDIYSKLENLIDEVDELKNK
jgi:hypothetical protein